MARLSDIQWGYTWPDAYLAVPEAEREERCRGGNDLMVIDGEAFFVRGSALPTPRISDSPVRRPASVARRLVYVPVMAYPAPLARPCVTPSSDG